MIQKNFSKLKQFSTKELQTAADVMQEVSKHLQADADDNARVHDAALTSYRTGESQTMEQAFADAFSAFLRNRKGV
jgi:hypothetical protein